MELCGLCEHQHMKSEEIPCHQCCGGDKYEPITFALPPYGSTKEEVQMAMRKIREKEKKMA